MKRIGDSKNATALSSQMHLSSPPDALFRSKKALDTKAEIRLNPPEKPEAATDQNREKYTRPSPGLF